jgi:type I restriction enzyme S subunit
VLDHINEFRLDGRFALIGEDGDHFLKFRERPMTLFVTGQFNVNNHAHVIADSDLCDAKWFYYHFLHKDLFRVLTRQGAGRYKLTKAALEKLPISLPPLQLQRYFIGILDQLEKAAGEVLQLCKLQRTFKRGLMQQLLTGRKRFPEFRDRPWVRRPFSDYFVEKSVANADRTVDLVYSCTKTAGIVPQAERFGKRLASKDLARYKVIEPGDLVYDPMLLWDGSIGFVPSNGRGVVSPAYETFKVKDAANREYFWPLLKSYNLVHRYKQISQGTNTRRRKAHPSDFLKTVVPMPPTKEEQDRIADVLCTAQREIDQLAQLHELIEAQRRALLSRLLSGSLAVP